MKTKSIGWLMERIGFLSRFFKGSNLEMLETETETIITVRIPNARR